MSSKVDMGPKVVICVVFCFSRWCLIVVALASLVVLFVLVVQMVFDVSKFLHCMFKRLPGNN